ncbi:hypothetical protein ACQEVZ_27795 [Dactylosporangium sp. CA-152071]|uniref:hypothetical protein n=1 Tax=Dactylosporangium sp. CA-152071 TaxID=3239933 RepID=UPI003D8DECEC
MQRWDPLNDRQLRLLQRIAAGDDLSGPDGVSDRRSGRALHDRGLLRVTRKGGTWQAHPTDAGRFYLEHGHHPDHPEHHELSGGSAPKQTTRKVVADTRPADRAPSTDATPPGTGSASRASAMTADKRRDRVQHEDHVTDGESLDSETAPRPRTSARRRTSEASTSAVSETPDQPAITADLVLSRLRAAGGKLVISDVGAEEFAAWRHAVKVAQLRLLRAGRQRLTRWTAGGELRLQLTPVQAADSDNDGPIEED